MDNKEQTIKTCRTRTPRHLINWRGEFAPVHAAAIRFSILDESDLIPWKIYEEWTDGINELA